jgi:hypothetical protein
LQLGKSYTNTSLVTKLSELHDAMKVAFATYIKESEKFEQDGVKVSAVRARQALNDLKILITERRKEIQDQKLNT